MSIFNLHIGPHKTGSTYIQKSFADKRDLLREHEIMYPNKWKYLWGHHNLVLALKSKKKGMLGKLRGDFNLINSFQGDVVISSENLEYLTKSEIVKLRGLIGHKNVKIIYFVRKWPKLIYSAWQEEVKHGSAETFHEYYSMKISKPFLSDTLNYSNVVERFSSVFNKNNIKIISYDNLIEFGTDIFKYFLNNVLGKGKSIEIQNKILNKSLDGIDIEIIRVLNGIHFHKKKIISNIVREAYFKSKDNGFIDLSGIKEIMDEYRQKVEVPGRSYVYQAIENQFIKRYGDCILNKTSEGQIFENISDETINLYKQGYLLNDRCRNKIFDIYSYLKTTIL